MYTQLFTSCVYCICISCKPMLVRMYVCMHVLYACMHACILIMYVCECVCMHHVYIDGGGKGRAVGLQPHLILRVLYGILIFYYGNILFSWLAPSDFAIFLHHCMCVHIRTVCTYGIHVNVYCVCIYLCMHKVLKTHIHAHKCSWDHIRMV